MKFLCVSDQVDPLVYSTTVKERYSDIDAVLCAGDLSMEYMDFIVDALGKPTFFIFGNHDLSEFHLYHRQTVLAQRPSQLAKMHSLENGHGADYINRKVLRLKNLSFKAPNGKTTPLLLAGVSGSIRYNKGEDQYTDFEMKLKLISMVPALIWNKIRYGRYCDIFLTHASPRHINDRDDPCHKGFECFNWFIKRFKPALLVHGHIHLYDLQAPRVAKSAQTTIVNAFSHIVIEYEPKLSEKEGDFLGSINIRTDR